MSIFRERISKWHIVMIVVQRRNMWFYEVIQGLARIDAKLVQEEDEWIAHLPPSGERTQEQMDRVYDHITMSQLWVMGAYEFARTFREQLDSDKPKHRQAELFKGLVSEFEKVRMPLAKLEIPKKFKEGVSIARPGLAEGKEAGWFVSKNFFITRRWLAEQFIQCFSNYEHFDPEITAKLLKKSSVS